jgi:hypothetical protein
VFAIGRDSNPPYRSRAAIESEKMRRWWAALAVVLFVASPIAQWRCAVACADDDAPVSNVCRHGVTSAAAVLAIPGDHDCGVYEAPPALVAKVSHAGTIGVLPAPSVTAAYAVACFSAPSIVTGASPGGPPGQFVTPLRV